MRSWKYTREIDLSPEQVRKTLESYDRGALAYAEQWEWDLDVQNRTKKDYLFPFIEHTKVNDSILVVGSGTGRDLITLHGRRYQCAGIDNSIGMLAESIKRGVTSPLVHEDIMNFHGVVESFDGILCESVLEHIPKREIKNLIERFYDWLRYDGILLMRLRLGTGSVFESQDRVGTRFFTSYTKKEINQILKDDGRMKVIRTRKEFHSDTTRPPFYSLLLKKL